jgi:hypothetical protein
MYSWISTNAWRYAEHKIEIMPKSANERYDIERMGTGNEWQSHAISHCLCVRTAYLELSLEGVNQPVVRVRFVQHGAHFRAHGAIVDFERLAARADRLVLLTRGGQLSARVCVCVNVCACACG